MSIEKPSAELETVTPEMSPDDFKDMISQIPTLKEMLSERKADLLRLESSPDSNPERINKLRVEIEELETEINERENSEL